MIDWWEENGPPIYLTAAGYFGLIKKKKSKGKGPKGGGDLNDLFKLAGPGGVIN